MGAAPCLCAPAKYPFRIHTFIKMTANLQFIPETVLVDFRIGNCPIERVILHKALVPSDMRLDDKSLRDFFQGYCEKNWLRDNIPDEGILCFCFVVEGHGKGYHVRQLLDMMDYELPLMGVLKDPRYVKFEQLLIRIEGAIAKRAAFVQDLMWFALNNLDYAQICVPFATGLRLVMTKYQKAMKDIPLVAMACADVLQGLDGADPILLLRAQLKRLRLIEDE